MHWFILAKSPIPIFSDSLFLVVIVMNLVLLLLEDSWSSEAFGGWVAHLNETVYCLVKDFMTEPS